MNNYNNYNNFYNEERNNVAALDNRVSAVMKRVYLKMCLALLVTAFVSLWCYATPAVSNFFFTHSGLVWGLFIVELVLVFAISGGINRMSSSTATLLFYLFAVINGLALFPIFFVYTQVSIAKTFFITAGTFGAMSIFGYFTSQDLTKWGSLLFMLLIGLIICSVVNIFMHSQTFEWIISGAGVLIFVGLTAWDTQKIKQLAIAAPAESTGKLATIGALSLYLDFINLFLYLLRFFGNSRD